MEVRVHRVAITECASGKIYACYKRFLFSALIVDFCDRFIYFMDVPASYPEKWRSRSCLRIFTARPGSRSAFSDPIIVLVGDTDPFAYCIYLLIYFFCHIIKFNINLGFLFYFRTWNQSGVYSSKGK